MALPNSQPALQGGARDFRTTHWSLVLAAGQEQSPRRAEALETLCRTYWPAIYAFVRRRGHDEHAAKDLTQAFFEHVLEKNSFGAADAQRGKFRTFLLTSLDHFLVNEWDKARRQKRGGGCEVVSLERDEVENRDQLIAAAPSPETVFDRLWAETVLDAVVSRLRKEFEREGNGRRFDVLKGFLISGQGTVSYAEAAAQLNTSEVGARSAVSRLRQRFRELMRDEIAHTVRDVGDVEEEMHHLFEALVN